MDECDDDYIDWLYDECARKLSDKELQAIFRERWELDDPLWVAAVAGEFGEREYLWCS